MAKECHSYFVAYGAGIACESEFSVVVLIRFTWDT